MLPLHKFQGRKVTSPDAHFSFHVLPWRIRCCFLFSEENYSYLELIEWWVAPALGPRADQNQKYLTDSLNRSPSLHKSGDCRY